MRTIRQIQVKWTSLVTYDEIGMYQIVNNRLQIALCLSVDANIALAYLRSKLTTTGWDLPLNIPCTAVPAIITPSLCENAFLHNLCGGDRCGK